MICRYGMLFQLYPLPNLNPHQPQFITKSYGTSCLYAQAHAMEAQLTLCKGKRLFAAYTYKLGQCMGFPTMWYVRHAKPQVRLHLYNYNFGRTHRHKFRRLVPLAGCACILRDEFMKIYTRSHKMSFIHVHMIQRPKAIHVYGYKSIEEPVKAKKMHNFFHIFAVCKHKKAFN